MSLYEITPLNNIVKELSKINKNLQSINETLNHLGTTLKPNTNDATPKFRPGMELNNS